MNGMCFHSIPWHVLIINTINTWQFNPHVSSCVVKFSVTDPKTERGQSREFMESLTFALFRVRWMLFFISEGTAKVLLCKNHQACIGSVYCSISSRPWSLLLSSFMKVTSVIPSFDALFQRLCLKRPRSLKGTGHLDHYYVFRGPIALNLIL